MGYVEKSRYVKLKAYSSTWVGKDCLPLQDICHILRKDMFFYRLYEGIGLVREVSPIQPDHTLPFHL